MPHVTRRDLFDSIGDGLFGAALALLGGHTARAAPAGGPRRYDAKAKTPHFAPKAKHVIQFFMNGGPSQIDLFDPKPALAKYSGDVPKELIGKVERIDQSGGLMPSPFRFARHGKCGMELSELLPHLAAQVDDIALVRSMTTTHFNHEPALYLMQMGKPFPTRPTLGSWVVYGLGSECEDLPAYVVLDDPLGLPLTGLVNWQSGWLPPVYQGTRIRSEGPPLINWKPEEEYPAGVQEAARLLLLRLSEAHRDQRPAQPDLDARMASYELAARMQTAASDVLDLSSEQAVTRESYGLDQEETASYGRRCLMARRLIERGVRIVQIYMKQSPWDHHSGLEEGLRRTCRQTDKPVTALIRDLKQRGLLESTLVIWGGEFGRLPLAQGKNPGRDHGPEGFSIWMAGGGIRGGVVHGTTDDLGYRVAERPVTVHDFHATVLHLLGLDHRKLIYAHHGREESLTDVAPARVVQEILS